MRNGLAWLIEFMKNVGVGLKMLFKLCLLFFQNCLLMSVTPFFLDLPI